jgi:GT2 family glycosyltransferase
MDISVIIPTYNGLSLLKKNLPHFLKVCQVKEIIIIDDGSTDNSVDYLSKNYPQIKLEVNQKNIGFARTVNKAARLASGDFLLILNNDVVPEPDFLAPLLPIIHKTNVFAVGPAEIDLKEGKKITSGRSWINIKQGMVYHNRCLDQSSGETAWVQGGSILVKKKLFLELGGFDPIYYPGYWEDIDLGWKANKAGLVNWFCAESVVHHHHGTTFEQKLGKKQIELLSYRNSLLFCWKNLRGKALITHLFWLPINLMFFSVKTRGLFLQSFILACLGIFSNVNHEKI